MSNASYPRSTTANTTVTPSNSTVNSTELLQTTNTTANDVSKCDLGASDAIFIYLTVAITFFVIIIGVYMLCINWYVRKNDTVKQMRRRSRRRESSQEVVEEVQMDLQEEHHEPRSCDYETKL